MRDDWGPVNCMCLKASITVTHIHVHVFYLFLYMYIYTCDIYVHALFTCILFFMYDVHVHVFYLFLHVHVRRMLAILIGGDVDG